MITQLIHFYLTAYLFVKSTSWCFSPYTSLWKKKLFLKFNFVKWSRQLGEIIMLSEYCIDRTTNPIHLKIHVYANTKHENKAGFCGWGLCYQQQISSSTQTIHAPRLSPQPSRQPHANQHQVFSKPSFTSIDHNILGLTQVLGLSSFWQA